MNRLSPEFKLIPEPRRALQPKDKLSRERLAEIGNRALLAAKISHDTLGKKGILPALTSNGHGDEQLMGDIRAEEAVLDVLTKTDIFWLVRSEEHGFRIVGSGIDRDTFGLIDERLVKEKRWGELKIKDQSVFSSLDPTILSKLLTGGIQPEAFASLDGWDGSKAAQEHYKGKKEDRKKDVGINTRYATMLALAPNPDPTYDQFTYGGMFEHIYKSPEYPKERGRLIYAIKGKGAREITPLGWRDLSRVRDDNLQLGPNTPGYYLRFNYFSHKKAGESIESYFDRHQIPRTRLLSTASHFADLVTGAQISQEAPENEKPIPYEVFKRKLETVVFVAETTRKGREELATAFIIGDEVGVVFRALINGQPRSIRYRKFLDWSEDKQIPVVAARNVNIANQLVNASLQSNLALAA